MTNWQKEHEHLLDNLNLLAGRRVQDFERDTAHLRGLALWAARALNERNTVAVANYYKERA